MSHHTLPSYCGTWADNLSAEDPRPRRDAVEVLRKCDEETIMWLIESLSVNSKPLFETSHFGTVTSYLLGTHRYPGRVVPLLASALVDRSSAPRRIQAAAAFSLLGKHLQPAIPQLIEALKDPLPAVCEWTAIALGKADPPAMAAITALRQAVGHPSTAVRCGAIIALGTIVEHDFALADTRVMGSLRKAARDREQSVAITANAVLGLLEQEPADAIALLREALRSGGPELRAQAAEALRYLGRLGADAVPDLITVLEDERSGLTARVNALHALNAMEESAVAAIPTMRESVKDPAAIVRYTAIPALGMVGEGDPDAVVAELLACLADAEALVRVKALYVLTDLFRHALSSVQPIVELIGREQNPGVLTAACFVLRQFGKRSFLALDALASALAYRAFPYVRISAAATLSSLGPAAVPALVEALGDEDYRVRREAAHALERIGPVGKEAGAVASQAVRELFRLLEDRVYQVRWEAAHALERSGLGEDPAVAKVLAEELAATEEPRSDPGPAERAEGLEVMGKEAQEMAELLEELQRIGEDCKRRGVNSFTLKEMARLLCCSENTVGNHIRKLSGFFKTYFVNHEHKTVYDDDDDSVPDQFKLFPRGQGRRGMTIQPLGKRAIELAGRYLDYRARRP